VWAAITLVTAYEDVHCHYQVSYSRLQVYMTTNDSWNASPFTCRISKPFSLAYQHDLS
jgi:hypothetical protein